MIELNAHTGYLKECSVARDYKAMYSARAAKPLVTPAPPFEEIISAQLNMIHRIAAAYESNPSAREDLVQEILCAVWRALPQFRGEGGLRSFVARIATNRAVTHVQRALSIPRFTELTDDVAASECSPEAHAMTLDGKDGLLKALRSLPIGLREPALLTLEGLTHQQIADALGLTANAVAIRMSRAKSRLKKLLQG